MGGITGSTLKRIALVSMLVDHLAASVIAKLYNIPGFLPEASRSGVEAFYNACRLFGRLAFPIYCFLLVEGFLHTSDKKRYAVRLFLFALISEIPFDWAINGQLMNWEHQNVFFTLLLGFAAMWGIDLVLQKLPLSSANLRIFAMAFIIIGVLILAWHVRADYGAAGVLVIVVLYLFHDNYPLAAAIGCLGLTAAVYVESAWSGRMQAAGVIGFLLAYYYNGQKGRLNKYFYYLFYPVHLLLLGAVSYGITLLT